MVFQPSQRHAVVWWSCQLEDFDSDGGACTAAGCEFVSAYQHVTWLSSKHHHRQDGSSESASSMTLHVDAVM